MVLGNYRIDRPCGRTRGSLLIDAPRSTVRIRYAFQPRTAVIDRQPPTVINAAQSLDSAPTNATQYLPIIRLEVPLQRVTTSGKQKSQPKRNHRFRRRRRGCRVRAAQRPDPSGGYRAKDDAVGKPCAVVQGPDANLVNLFTPVTDTARQVRDIDRLSSGLDRRWRLLRSSQAPCSAIRCGYRRLSPARTNRDRRSGVPPTPPRTTGARSRHPTPPLPRGQPRRRQRKPRCRG